MSLGLAAALAVLLAPAPAVDAGYVHDVEAWRAKREADLRAPEGWLSVVGLHWLREGTSTLGSAQGSDILLPQPAPPRVGTVALASGKVTVRVEPGVTVKVQEKAVTEVELHSDKAGKPDVLTVGPVSLFVIDRGGRL